MNELLVILNPFVESMNANFNIDRPSKRRECASLNFMVFIECAVGECSNVKNESQNLGE